MVLFEFFFQTDKSHNLKQWNLSFIFFWEMSSFKRCPYNTWAYPFILILCRFFQFASSVTFFQFLISCEKAVYTVRFEHDSIFQFLFRIENDKGWRSSSLRIFQQNTRKSWKKVVFMGQKEIGGNMNDTEFEYKCVYLYLVI